ncbi:hypothetical protein [Bacillus sp. MMSF_3328]|uniref:hypothetical protein n=1 Tax=Bacillus sp. MMSF_3328 TaxID=3047080 RepID=UPI00273DFCAF|nr:hypothetical protein [Bacillus sp. MMSF_3328]
MASKTFKATWMGQYTASNAAYYGASNPIRVGGGSWFHSYLGFDKNGILAAINSSKTAARVYLNVYVTKGAEFDVGYHKEGSNKASNGLPFYRYGNIHPILGTGWQRIDLTDAPLQTEGTAGFKNIMNAGYTGPVLYGGNGATQGEAYGVTNNQFHIYIEVTGTWNTAPGAPKITAPTAGQSVDKTFELKGTAAADAEQSSTGLRYEWGIRDGSGTWQYLGFGAYGVINKVVDFTNYAEGTNAQVALRANDGELTGPWAYSSLFTISHNKAPGAPTDLAPVGGAQRDRTQAITFSWVHNDADGQSAYDFRWRLQGNELWNESGKISTTSKTRLVAANTFPQGAIEWQVRTYDQASLVGPWSATAIFNATEASDAPVISSPVMNAIIPTSRVNVTWTAAEQDEYELQLVQAGIVVWTESQVSNNRVVEIPYDLLNNTSYQIRLRTRLSTELWSAWAEVTVNTSFTTPATPEVTLFEWVEEGAIDIRINNPVTGTVGEPNVEYNDIYRRVYGTDDPYVRIAHNVSNNGAFRDYTPASGVTYEYYVRAWGDNGTFQDSLTNTILITLSDTVISLASNPLRVVRLEYNPSRSVSRKKERQMMQFNGRTFPVAEFGLFETWNISLNFTVRDRVSLDVLLEIIDSKETMLYRDARGRREFVTVDAVDVDDRFPDGYNVKFSPERVEYNEEV